MPKSKLISTESLRKQRNTFRVMLLNQFLLVGLLSAILQFFINFFVGVDESNYTELSFIAILLTLLLINKKGYFSLARIGTLLIVNSAIYITYKLEPTGGIQYFYFPMLVLSLVLHDPKDWPKSLIYGFLPVFLFLYDTSMSLENRDIISVLINFSTASMVSSIAIVYLIRANINNENLLVKANKEVSEVGEELRINNKILAKTNNELDKFMYSSSHDLRAPLSSILGLVNLAKLEPIEKQADYIEMIRDRVIGLDYFIKDIIDFSKNSNTDIRHEIIDVKDLIEQCVDHNKYLPKAEFVKLALNIQVPKIQSDVYRLSSILTTLIANAVKYHNYDQDQPMLWINVQGENPVVFTISDNGLGFNKHIKAKIFDMFYRGNEKSTGSGLGLYIAQEMLNSLRGTIEVTSDEGKGSCFTFYLPKPA